ncbi:MAG: hypothetical protein M0P61_00050 [Ignavibacteriaceae bacterium]|jgi:hypothetical protein|nr:hypothetical protein [Ignavibacteriaceae bacterium]
MSKQDFRVFSTVQCTEPGCTKKIKQNVINRKPDADKCFRHWPFARRNRCQGRKSADSSQQLAVGNN